MVVILARKWLYNLLRGCMRLYNVPHTALSKVVYRKSLKNMASIQPIQPIQPYSFKGVVYNIYIYICIIVGWYLTIEYRATRVGCIIH